MGWRRWRPAIFWRKTRRQGYCSRTKPSERWIEFLKRQVLPPKMREREGEEKEKWGRGRDPPLRAAMEFRISFRREKKAFESYTGKLHLGDYLFGLNMILKLEFFFLNKNIFIFH
jgi:hypothetical protein